MPIRRLQCKVRAWVTYMQVDEDVAASLLECRLQKAAQELMEKRQMDQLPPAKRALGII